MLDNTYEMEFWTVGGEGDSSANSMPRPKFQLPISTSNLQSAIQIEQYMIFGLKSSGLAVYDTLNFKTMLGASDTSAAPTCLAVAASRAGFSPQGASRMLRLFYVGMENAIEIFELNTADPQ